VNYFEFTAADYAAAKTLADAQITGAADYVVVQVGTDVVVFAGDTGGASDTSIVLVGKTLADISASNII
jgi:hypothetical protein